MFSDVDSRLMFTVFRRNSLLFARQVGDVAVRAAHELDDTWRLIHERGTGDADLQETALRLELSARSIRRSNPQLADAVTT